MHSAQELSTAETAAVDMVRLRLNDKKERIERNIRLKEKQVEDRGTKWPEHILSDISEVTTLKDRLQRISSVQVCYDIDNTGINPLKLPEKCG